MTRPGSWLDSSTDSLGVAIARRALLDVGICETPPGSNRAPEIDEYLKRLGVPVGLPWCAAAVTEWFRVSGAKVPDAAAASTDAWLRWAKAHGLFQPTPAVGSAVLYGKGDDAEHIGVVVRLTPLVMTVEGNTKLDSSPTREGIAVDLKLMNEGWKIGFVRPVLA